MMSRDDAADRDRNPDEDLLDFDEPIEEGGPAEGPHAESAAAGQPGDGSDLDAMADRFDIDSASTLDFSEAAAEEGAASEGEEALAGTGKKKKKAKKAKASKSKKPKEPKQPKAKKDPTGASASTSLVGALKSVNVYTWMLVISAVLVVSCIGLLTAELAAYDFDIPARQAR